MFITRASRRDLRDVRAFYDAEGWFEGHDPPDLTRGTIFVARQGPVVGCLRLIEVEPNVLVVEDVVVATEHRGEGVGMRLVQAALNSRGGTMYLCCHEDRVRFYEGLGFRLAPFDGLPEAVQAYMRAADAYPTEPGHVHLFMRAR